MILVPGRRTGECGISAAHKDIEIRKHLIILYAFITSGPAGEYRCGLENGELT